MITDKAEVAGVKYFMVLAGDLSVPEKAWLIKCAPLKLNINNEIVCPLFDDSLRDFCIVLTGFASYNRLRDDAISEHGAF